MKMIALFKQSTLKKYQFVSIHAKRAYMRFMLNWMVFIFQGHHSESRLAKTLLVSCFDFIIHICSTYSIYLLSFNSHCVIIKTDASIVRADGPGLKNIVTGQKTYFAINTCDAGVGNYSL